MSAYLAVTPAEPLLRMRDIVVSLGGRQVLSEASLDVAAGEIVAVVGPNGAGKSTLLRAAAGLLRGDRGSVTLLDRPLDAWDRAGLAATVAYLPQDGRVHWPLSVRSVVGLGRIPFRTRFGAMSAVDEAAVAAAMAAADVTTFADRSVGALSGGERSRVLLARALAQGARLLIADEPTAGLDPGHVLAMFEHFVRLADARHAIVVALHDLSAAARYCHRVVLLKAGRVVAAGPPREVLTPDSLADAYGIAAELVEIAGVPTIVAKGRLASREGVA